jgi:hypothetical protein
VRAALFIDLGRRWETLTAKRTQNWGDIKFLRNKGDAYRVLLAADNAYSQKKKIFASSITRFCRCACGDVSGDGLPEGL